MVKLAVSTGQAETLFIKLETILTNMPAEPAIATVGVLKVVGELAG
jgi:hypothetical protein